MIDEVRRRIAAACERAGRERSEVKLVAVTKGHPVAEIEERVVDEGCLVLGESRLQEWRAKEAELTGRGIEWHLIGNLQRNKIKYCLPFHTIHSLNSRRLADALQAYGERSDHRFRVLVEVNVAGEESKLGIGVEEAAELVAYARALPNLQVAGLMTMAPHYDDPEQARPVFRGLRGLRDKLGLVELSMGMSNDFEVAVEEGATIVRVGSALFDGSDA
ncbi:MAG TPA: YggS family pyridoxal phosphate-dependent enzyme [Trueperaceae bacterium]